MNTKDLFELASLDALGLLDEQERKGFEDAFQHAAPAIQAQIRREQARFSDIDSLLPDVRPPQTLRERVLAAVQAAIGAGGAVRMHAGGRAVASMLPSRRVSPVWRAGALACAAAAIFFGVTTIQMRMQYSVLEETFKDNAVAQTFLKEYGPAFERELMDKDTRFIQFASDVGPVGGAGGHEPAAVLLLDAEKKTGQFYVKDLPADIAQYSLVVVTPDGKVGEALLAFKPTDAKYHHIPKLEIPGGATLQVVPAVAGGRATSPVLKSTSL